MDKISVERVKTLSPLIQEEALMILQESDEALSGKAILRYTHCGRTLKQQADIWALGRTVVNKSGYDPIKKPFGNIVTWAKPGESYHNYGLAVDGVLLLDKDVNGTFESASWDTKLDFDGDGIADWMEVVQVFLKYGWEWGGNWGKPKTDTPHFQKTLGLSIAQLQKISPNKVYDGVA